MIERVPSSKPGIAVRSLLATSIVLLALGRFGVTDDPAPTEDGTEPTRTEGPRTAVSREFPDAAALNVDGELERFLANIESARQRRPLDAIGGWQQMLDGMAGIGPVAGNASLRSFHGKAEWARQTVGGGAYAGYSSIRAHVEGRQRELGEAERKDYLLVTGPDAELAWAEVERTGSVAALEATVTRFFNGPRGDDAAVALAARSLVRGDPIGAYRLLDRVLIEHPDPDVDLTTVRLRLVVAAARAGDLERARTEWAGIRNRFSRRPRTIAFIERELARGDDRSADARSGPWVGGNGDSNGRRLAPTLAVEALADRVTEAWSLPLGVRPVDVAPPGFEVGLPRDGSAPRPFDAPFVVPAWEEFRRTPARHAVPVDGRLYVQGEGRLICCDAATGRVLWMGRESAWPSEPLLARYATQRIQFAALPRAPDEDEARRFFDELPAQFAVNGRNVYAIEGFETAPPALSTKELRRIRRSTLAAYDAVSGIQLWRRKVEEGPVPLGDVGFLGAPAIDGDRLVVPVTAGGEVWAYGLERTTGRTLWRTYLCDEPPGGCNPWSPVRIVTSGRSAYVLSGSGLVTSLDTATGNVDWAVRYRRTTFLPLSPEDRMRKNAPTFDADGWDRDGLIVAGRFLVVMPSDADRLFAIDRRDGTVAWDTAAQPFPDEGRARYGVGLVGRRLVVGGYDLLRAYDVRSGRIEWQARLEGATGRGVVTPDAVYVPVGETLEVRSPSSGALERRVEFASPFRKPLGNLVTDGRRLYVAGATRAFAVEPLNRRFESLAGRVDAGDPFARVERSRLLSHLGRSDEAFEDVVAAARSVDPVTELRAATAILRAAGDLDLGRTHPDRVLTAITTGGLAEVPRLDGSTPEERTLVQLWNTVAHEGLTAIAREERSGATRAILTVAGRADDPYVRTAVRLALDATVTPNDLPLLSRTIRDEGPGRVAAVHALAVDGFAESPEVDALLEELQRDDGGTVRLAAAEATLGRGDRSALGLLVELLDDDELAVRTRAGRLLELATGADVVFDPHHSGPERQESIEAWRSWTELNAETADLATDPLRPRLPRGRILVSSSTRGVVVEYDRDRNQVWQASVPNAYGVCGMPDGRRVVASYTGQFLVVFAAGDGEAKEVWRKDGLPGRPYAVRALPNGHLLVAYYNTGSVEEYDATGKKVWEATLKGSVADARRLDDGRTLVTWYGGNSVVELDRAGRIARRFDDRLAPRSGQRLPNGNTLVAEYRRNQVVEVDPEGLVVWSYENALGVQSAQRLANGNTLMVHRTGVVEVHPDGSPVWRVKGAGYSRVHAY